MNKSEVSILLLVLLLPIRVVTFFTEEARRKREASERNRRIRDELEEKSFLDCIVADGCVVLGPRDVGFFSEFFGVLNWLRWAEKSSVEVKVVWGGDGFLYSNDNCNHWHDFFEPFWNEESFFNTKKNCPQVPCEGEGNCFFKRTRLI